MSGPAKDDWTSPDGTVLLLVGDCIDRLKDLPAESVHCVVTSPPYWGLRDYGTATWEGGDAGCDHTAESRQGKSGDRATRTTGHDDYFRDVCGKCGASRIDQQIGLEATPEEFVAKMVAVFREVRRVLRSDGVCWVNLGDSYASAGGIGHYEAGSTAEVGNTLTGECRRVRFRSDDIKPKDLVGIPWMVAFALRADGWWLRQDIIWSKLNPMPESVTDRCTKAHEYVFLLTKSARYFYDAEAIKQPGNPNDHNGKSVKKGGFDSKYAGDVARIGDESFRAVRATRNRRSVWTIATQAYPEAHFATYPVALVEPCIKAGTSERGCCAKCGAPWERVLERGPLIHLRGNSTAGPKANEGNGFGRLASGLASSGHVPGIREQTTVGWQPTCDCGKGTGQSDRDIPSPVPCTVLDPFAGSGTTLQVARVLGRHAIGCELSADYAELAKVRSMSTLEGSDDTRPLFEPQQKPKQQEMFP